ncbi:terminase family protein [Thermodesulfovibrio sp.]|uniref:terminase large subunit domain-containing protein n=1 Tax=Thermodesulfovibrio sp. TaxID=2067987 RepID=UPI00309C8682
MFRLLPYQQKWLNDKSRFKIALKARQIGFTTALCFEAIEMALTEKCRILILSTTERQSREVIDRIYDILNVAKRLKGIKLPRETRSEIAFPNGSRIISLPASPTSVRGYTGHVFLDEFAFHKDAKEIWRAMLPITTRGYSVRIVSTPAGKSGKFYELWENAEGFSRHKVDIHDAIKQGFNIDLNAIKSSMDPDDFAQEYECVFLDEAHSYFPMELIIQAISAECDRWDGIPRGQFYVGVDIGRKKDLTVLYVLEKLGDVFYTREIKELFRTEFDAQRREIEAVIERYPVSRLCIDETGLGMQLAEELKKRYTSLIEPVSFTLKVKEDLATFARVVFEQQKIRIPDNQALIRDIHSIKKIVTSAGNIRFDSERNEISHADRFWALALALHAGNQYAGPIYIASRRRREAVELTRGF